MGEAHLDMEEDRYLNWIYEATYEELLRAWRFAPIESPILQKPYGKLFINQMRKKGDELYSSQKRKISNKVGWSVKDGEEFDEFGNKR